MVCEYIDALNLIYLYSMMLILVDVGRTHIFYFTDFITDFYIYKSIYIINYAYTCFFICICTLYIHYSY